MIVMKNLLLSVAIGDISGVPYEFEFNITHITFRQKP